MTALPPIAAFSAPERQILAAMIDRGLNAPVTTSAGRLFDAVAALTGLRQSASYEGQAAAELEWAIEDAAASTKSEGRRYSLPPCGGGLGRGVAPPYAIEAQPLFPPRLDDPPSLPSPTRGEGEDRRRFNLLDARHYVFALRDGARPEDAIVVDWEPALCAMLADIRGGAPTAMVSARFHAGLAAMIGAVAARVGEPNVALTGGCFQNARLTEATIETLRAAGLTPYWHERAPPNDGGLALGQAAWAARMIKKGEASCA